MNPALSENIIRGASRLSHYSSRRGIACCLFGLVMLFQLAHAQAEPKPHSILAFGDSLTFGVGGSGRSYPAALQTLLGVTVINAGVPGEVTGEGLLRLPSVLEQTRPEIVLICLGTNDFLRGIPVDQVAENLRAMVELVLARNAKLMVLAMAAPGQRKAAALFDEIPQSEDLVVDRQSLVEVAGNALNKADLVHLNQQGYLLLAERIAFRLREAGWVASHSAAP